MLLIFCPYCEEHRDEGEFLCQGEAFIARPTDPETLTDAAWGDYLFFRQNPRGPHYEMWFHAAGCRRYFNALRDTATYVIHATRRMGEAFAMPSGSDQPAQSGEQP